MINSSKELQEATNKKYKETKEELLKYKKILVAKLTDLKKKEQEIEQLNKSVEELQTTNNKLRRDNIELTKLSKL